MGGRRDTGLLRLAGRGVEHDVDLLARAEPVLHVARDLDLLLRRKRLPRGRLEGGHDVERGAGGLGQVDCLRDGDGRRLGAIGAYDYAL